MRIGRNEHSKSQQFFYEVKVIACIQSCNAAKFQIQAKNEDKNAEEDEEEEQQKEEVTEKTRRRRRRRRRILNDYGAEEPKKAPCVSWYRVHDIELERRKTKEWIYKGLFLKAP